MLWHAREDGARNGAPIPVVYGRVGPACSERGGTGGACHAQSDPIPPAFGKSTARPFAAMSVGFTLRDGLLLLALGAVCSFAALFHGCGVERIP